MTRGTRPTARSAASPWRRPVRVGALTVGGAVLLVSGSVGLMAGEVKLARRWVGRPTERPPATSGWYGHYVDEPLRLATLGDSSVAGIGVEYAHETMAAILAAGLAAMARRPVRLTNVAVSGSRTSDLARQVDRVLEDAPDVALIVIGANDVTGFVSPKDSAAVLGEQVARLVGAGVPVVVGTCPDLGTVRPVLPPLRQVGWLWSRMLARQQTIAAVEAGGRSVSLGALLGPTFRLDPLMWSPDRFHPSADGYVASASALLPSVAVAAGVLPEVPAEPTPARTMSVAAAATAAVSQDGTEVVEIGPAAPGPTAPGGAVPSGAVRRRALRRLPARLRRRRPPRVPPAASDADGGRETGTSR